MTTLSKLNDSIELLCEFLCRLKEYIVNGQFGIVYHCLLIVTGVDSEGEVKEVAVKTMENGTSEEERAKFLQEAAIMSNCKRRKRKMETENGNGKRKAEKGKGRHCNTYNVIVQAS